MPCSLAARCPGILKVIRCEEAILHTSADSPAQRSAIVVMQRRTVNEPQQPFTLELAVAGVVAAQALAARAGAACETAGQERP